MLSRRSFIGAAVGGTVTLAGAHARTASAQDQIEAFGQGVASGDPRPDRVVLWTRVRDVPGVGDRAEVAWEVAADPSFADVRAGGTTTTSAAADHTVQVDATGLAPATTYWYRFTTAGVTSPVGRTRTTAAPGASPERLRLGVVTCAEYEFGFFGAYRHLAGRDDLDAVLHLGDYIYEFGVGYGSSVSAATPGPALGRTHNPPRECLTLADYRTRYAQYRSDPDLRRLHAAHPMIVIYDDHEVANDTWEAGAENHQPEEGDFGGRAAVARRAFQEWMPIRQVDPDDVDVVHRSFAFGDLAELFVLDERRYRDQQPANAFFSYGSVDPAITDPNRTMLGAAQRAWLVDGLEASPATWKLLGNPVPFFPFVVGPALASTLTDVLAPALDALPPIPPPLTVDDWNGYQAEQQALVGVFGGLEDVVVLTGDYHESVVAEVPSRPGDYTFAPGSVAVEFVAPSVTSPGLGATLEAGGLPDAQAVEAVFAANLRLANPWVRYHEARSNGFGVLEVTAERAQYDFWYLDDPLDPTSGARPASSWQVARGTARALEAPGPLVDLALRPDPAPPGAPSPDQAASDPSGRLPATGGSVPLGPAAVGAVAALGAITARRAAVRRVDEG